MNKLKKKLKQDLTSKLEVDLSFDVTKLPIESKKMKRFPLRKVILATIGCVLLCFFSIPFISSIQSKTSVKEVKRKFALNDLKMMESETFQKLNTIIYPNHYEPQKVDEDFKISLLNFVNKIYQVSKNINENYSFAPLSLYQNLNNISLATNQQEILNVFDTLFEINYQTRQENIRKMFQNDFFANENGTLQMYNSVFLTNKYEANQNFINQLSTNYTEAFQLDFLNNYDIEKMLDWVDQRMNTTNYIDVNDFEIDDLTSIYFLSTFYFDQKWFHTFSSKNNFVDDFYTQDGQKIKTTFMNHTYYGYYYDYDQYVSFYDNYTNGIKIQYLVPKSLEGENIFDLIGNKNIFLEDESKKVENCIDLSLPKLDLSYQIDFTESLKILGLNELFDSNSQSLNHAFKNVEDSSIYLKWVKQKNAISFHEDGTTIRSLTFSMGAAKSAAPMVDVLEVKLDQPFIYIIYDSNDLPLYLGYVVHPTLK